jgi:Cu/Ag efflux protein CusF
VEVNDMKMKVFLAAATLLVGVVVFAGAPAYADDKPDEGRIVRVVADAKLITVQDDNGDQFDLMWNETTRMEGNATFAQLKPGDYVHFEYVEREGQKFLTEIKRTSRAKD